MSFDAQLLSYLNQLAQQHTWVQLAVTFTAVPLVWLLAAWYALALVMRSHSKIRELVAILAGSLAGYLTSALIGHFWFRVRPFAAGAAHLIIAQPYVFKSFPSDHATAAFYLALLLTHKRPGWWWSYLVAALVAFGRVAAGVHYPTDVLAGALVGTFFGLVTLWLADMLARAFVNPTTK